jgi:hypothetical protein
MTGNSSSTERRPARDGRPARGAQVVLVVVALVALAVAVEHAAIAADRHGWAQHDGTVSSVEPQYDMFALFARALGGGAAPTDYTITVRADDELFFVTMEERPIDGQSLTVYVDPETGETILESPWVPTGRGAAAIAVTVAAALGWGLILWRSRKMIVIRRSTTIEPSKD